MFVYINVLQAFVAVSCDDLDDFPLDGVGSDVTDNDESPNTTVEGEMPMSNLDMDEVPSDESV